MGNKYTYGYNELLQFQDNVFVLIIHVMVQINKQQ